MAGIHLKTAPRAHLAPVVSVAASPAPTSRAVATFREREAQLQTSADAIRREIEPALGDCGMVLGDRDLDGLSRAIASGSALARSVTVELIARRLNLEELALEIPDELIGKENYGLDPVF